MKNTPEKIAAIETTVRTFLHDIDNHDPADGEIVMSGWMWLQVAAFRELVGTGIDEDET